MLATIARPMRARIDAPVAVEAAVLDRDEGGRGQRVELGDVDRRCP